MQLEWLEASHPSKTTFEIVFEKAYEMYSKRKRLPDVSKIGQPSGFTKRVDTFFYKHSLFRGHFVGDFRENFVGCFR